MKASVVVAHANVNARKSRDPVRNSEDELTVRSSRLLRVTPIYVMPQKKATVGVQKYVATVNGASVNGGVKDRGVASWTRSWSGELAMDAERRVNPLSWPDAVSSDRNTRDLALLEWITDLR
jgi:hypothetical protein